MKNVKIVNIKTTFKKIFKEWLILTQPFHKLKGKELEILSLYLYYFYIYKKDIKKENLIWKILFNYDTKKLIKDEIGIGNASFQNIMSSFRKKKIIINNTINKLYIPNINEDQKSYKIIYNLIYES